MENLKALTAQQFAIATAGSLLVGGAMLSHGNNLGFLFLALSAACGLAAFVKYKKR
ncbi:hypothetical protein ACFCQI_07575 [Rhodanobacter sp. FW102-FHT14D06]|uniref:Uncharacterized protein n=2 Tax=unclassified Rhodanobacter TaxID=2621553 RepID=A0AB74UPA6_9GAMM